ncbi:hypothetical protein BDW59DRAFT_160294 [Aspergillus cavernicola]|uniref:DUF7779 domain-containing protein n=1 Tax=Aspergillus cavernicola TaxID=176166 RepID=A0ABR4IIB9_9EURO
MDKFDAVFWVTADTTLKLAQGYTDIAVELGLVADGSAPPDSARRGLLRWFQNTPQKWLLILDNVEGLEVMLNHWPVGSQGRIIITSQNFSVSHPPITASRLVEPFDVEEGAQALLSLLPDNVSKEPGVQESIRQISAGCGGLPLALNQSASFAQSTMISVKELAQICSSSAAFVYSGSVLNTVPEKNYYYAGNVSTALSQALHSLSSSAAFLVKLMAWFDPDGIPERLVRQDSTLHAELQPFLKDESEYFLSLKSLLSRLLITKSTTQGTFLMHRLAQAAIIHGMSEDEKLQTFNAALGLVNRIFPGQENWQDLTGKWPDCALALSHVYRLRTLQQQLNVSLSVKNGYILGELLERTAWYLFERRQLDESLELLDQTVSVAEAAVRLAVDQPAEEQKLKSLLIDVINDQACIKFAECHFSKAKDLFLQSLAMKEALGSANKNEICNILTNIGNAYANLGMLDESYDYLKRAFDLRQEQLTSVPDPENYKEHLGRNWGTLSGCLWLMGKYEQAWEYAQYSTELCKQVHGDDITLAGCYVSLGNIKQSQGLHDEAKQLHLKALDIYTSKYGNHFYTAMALHRYGKLLFQENNLGDAIDCLNRAVTILETSSRHNAARSRSLYLLAELKDNTAAHDGAAFRDKALMLYAEHTSQPFEEVKQAGITMEQFDRLVSCWQW